MEALAALAGVLLGAWIAHRAGRQMSPVPSFKRPAPPPPSVPDIEPQPAKVRI